MDSTKLHSSRIESLDFLRGLVMVLMVIDHVRVYSGQPAGGIEPGIFFTRWVTHFCAPVFVFLAGTSAYLYYQRSNSIATVRRFLLSRGILLVILELTVIRFSWTFNFNYNEFILAGVIWMLGLCMIFLALLLQFGATVVGIAGLIIVFFQNALAMVPRLLPDSMQSGFGKFWEFIYSSGFEGPAGVTILYVLVPWIGVMAAGYGFGKFFDFNPERRKKYFLYLGGAMVLLFLAAATFRASQLGPDSGGNLPFWHRLLNQQKYPASQLFLMMTLGPAVLLLAYTEQFTQSWLKAIATIGKVPFFFYLLHIPLIHVSAIALQYFLFGQVTTDAYGTAPYTYIPPEFKWSLGWLYFVFLVDTLILYFACRWYASYKSRNPQNVLLKYI